MLGTVISEDQNPAILLINLGRSHGFSPRDQTSYSLQPSEDKMEPMFYF